jgi:hypothetical protein
MRLITAFQVIPSYFAGNIPIENGLVAYKNGELVGKEVKQFPCLY